MRTKKQQKYETRKGFERKIQEQEGGREVGKTSSKNNKKRRQEEKDLKG